MLYVCFFSRKSRIMTLATPLHFRPGKINGLLLIRQELRQRCEDLKWRIWLAFHQADKLVFLVMLE